MFNKNTIAFLSFTLYPTYRVSRRNLVLRIEPILGVWIQIAFLVCDKNDRLSLTVVIISFTYVTALPSAKLINKNITRCH